MRGIAISGKAGAGKNLLADLISDRLVERGHWPVVCAFGDELKADVLAKYGLTKHDPGGRERLVRHGEEKRLEHSCYWIDRLYLRLFKLWRWGLVPIVADVRFGAEFDQLRADGFYLVRIDADPTDRSVALYGRGEDVSFAWSIEEGETELDERDFDMRFWNPHGDHLAALRLHAAEVVERYCLAQDAQNSSHGQGHRSREQRKAEYRAKKQADAADAAAA